MISANVTQTTHRDNLLNKDMCADRNVSPDVDRGVAFVVAVAGMVTGIFTFGLIFSNSIFYAVFLDEFQESPVTTAWAVNLNSFCFFGTGIFTNCVLLMIGPRQTIIIGCLLSSVGYIACSFATSIIGILGLYGIVTGTGYCFVHLATYSAIPNYYKKYRIIATVIANTGAGLGQFILPPVIRFLIDQYHWRGVCIILAAANLNLLIVAAVLMPPRYLKVEQNTDASCKEEVLSKKDRVFNVFKNLRTSIFLFRYPHWTLFCFSRLFIQIGSGGFQTHIYNFGRQPFLDLTPIQATFLPSIVGIGSIVGRLVGGGVAQLLPVSVVFVYILMFSIIVVAGIVITLGRNYHGIACSCFLAGFGLGGNALYFETVIHIVGIKSYSTAMSYAMVFSAIGFLFGGPLAAWIYEMDPSYLWTFAVITIILAFAVIINIPAWLTVSDGKIHERLSRDEAIRREDERRKISETTKESFEECITHM